MENYEEKFTNEELCEILSIKDFKINKINDYKVENKIVYVNKNNNVNEISDTYDIEFSINDLVSFCIEYVEEIFCYDYELENFDNKYFEFTIYDIEDEGGFGFFDKTFKEDTEYKVMVKTLKFMLTDE